MLVSTLLLSMAFVQAPPAAPLVSGRWKVTVEDETGASRTATLCIHYTDGELAEATLEWHRSKERPHVIEHLIAAWLVDRSAVEFYSWRSESEGAPWPPSRFLALPRGDGTELAGMGWGNAVKAGQRVAWTARWLDAEMPSVASSSLGGGERSPIETWTLRSVSERHRRDGIEVWDCADPVVLKDLAAMEEALPHAVGAHGLELDRIRLELVDNTRMKALESQFQSEMRRFLLGSVLDGLTGRDPEVQDFGDFFGGADGTLSQLFDLQLGRVALQGEQLRRKHELRADIREQWVVSTGASRAFESQQFPVSCAAEGESILLSVRNRSDEVLSGAVVMIELVMNPERVDATVRARLGTGLARWGIQTWMNLSQELIVKNELFSRSTGDLLALPTGTQVHLDRWEPGSELEMFSGTSLLQLMQLTASAELWIGCDQGILRCPLDLDDLRQPILKWHEAGRPAHARSKPKPLPRIGAAATNARTEAVGAQGAPRGRWSGSGVADGYEYFTVTLDLDGTTGGRVDYPSRGCRGRLQYVGQSGNTFVYSEELESGRGTCQPVRRILIVPNLGSLDVTWTTGGGRATL